jgi:hypothetical protein
MIKTLRITSVAVVLFAAVVLASVLGYLRPASLVHLNFGPRSDKQTDKILSGPSAVDRFNEQYRSKATPDKDTTSPLVKEAETFAGILSPPVVKLPDGPGNAPPRPTMGGPVAKPAAQVSGKFDLLGTCYSSDPKASFAYIRLPDSTYQWVGVGSEIGRVTIKEIRNGSIVYSDGKNNVEMNAESVPETSCMLETGKVTATSATSTATPTPAVSQPRSAATTKPAASPVKSSMASGRSAVPVTPTAPAQISKEEQANLSQLGSRLKSGMGADSNAATDKLIAEYKSTQTTVPEVGKAGTVGTPSEGNKDSLKEETRRQWQKRLTIPRSMKK